MADLTTLALLNKFKERIAEIEKQVGPEGPTGPQGPQGERGADGIQGERGPAGERGSDGLQGPQGEAGQDGEDGRGIVSIEPTLDGDLEISYNDGTTEVVETASIFGPTRTESAVYVKHAGQDETGAGGGGGNQHELTSPEFTYTSGLLTRVDYDHGEYKILAYNSDDQLTTVTLYHHNGNVISTKTLTYNTDGTLASVSET